MSNKIETKQKILTFEEKKHLVNVLRTYTTLTDDSIICLAGISKAEFNKIKQNKLSRCCR